MADAAVSEPPAGNAPAEAPRTRRSFVWPLVLLGLFAGALILRLVGLRTGLPYIYNADENAHFVPRAVGMFGHSLNPDYFINPPAYTYLVHLAYLVRYGSDPATIGAAYATNLTGPFTIARAVSAVLGALAVPFTAIAGARLFGDRRTGALAGGLLAVAFLAVHYSHFALNDAPTLAPATLALVGIAGVYSTGRTREYVLAAIALGLAIATKYTAGILVLTLVAASIVSTVPHRRIANLVLCVILICAGFLIASPYSLLDHKAFTDGLTQQTETAGDDGGKLGLASTNGWVYYFGTFWWGFGWLPSLAALGGAVAMGLRKRAYALILLPAPVVLLLYLGHQTRFFSRWLLPIYPLLALIAAWAVVEVTKRWRFALPIAAGLVLLQGLVYTIHNDVVLARADTRQVARDWMVKHIPAGANIVVEPIAPDQWAADPGYFDPATGSGNRWNKWRTSRSLVGNNGQTLKVSRVVKLEDYERTTRPELVRAYRASGFCWVVTGSTQTGRAYADPKVVPQAIKYYDTLKANADVVFHIKPESGDVPFSFDSSFNYMPLSYSRPGPEVIIYRLRNCTPS